MSSFKSHIYDRSEVEDIDFNWPLILLFLTIGLLGYLLVDVNPTLGLLLMFLSIIASYASRYKDWGKQERQGKFVGEIILTGDVFTLNGEKIDTSEIKDLKIEIGHTKGYKEWHRYGYTVSCGTKSCISLTARGVKYVHNFGISSVDQLNDLKKVLENLYSRGVFVKEFYLGVRTYLFNDLGYEDIQKFKKKYRLN